MPTRGTEEPTPNVTAILLRASSGDEVATRDLFPLVYDELRRLATQHLAQERRNHTLQPTALVNEAYLRLVGPGDVSWQNRAHFFGAAAQAIRRILMDHARTRNRQKRGGGQVRVLSLDGIDVASEESDSELLALDEALTKLAAADPVKAKVVEMRYFAGLSIEETARAMGISTATVSRHWEFARTWLHRELLRSEGD
jgi:RNA polymerase sigma factor (TIGR02999 family)